MFTRGAGDQLSDKYAFQYARFETNNEVVTRRAIIRRAGAFLMAEARWSNDRENVGAEQIGQTPTFGTDPDRAGLLTNTWCRSIDCIDLFLQPLVWVSHAFREVADPWTIGHCPSTAAELLKLCVLNARSRSHRHC